MAFLKCNSGLSSSGSGKAGIVYNLGTGTSFNIKTLFPDVDYTKLTANNFICGMASANAGYWYYSWGHNQTQDEVVGYSINKSYNASTGVFSVNSWSRSNRGYEGTYYGIGADATPFVYLVVYED